MNIAVELFLFCFELIYLYIKALLALFYRPRKDVNRKVVLITGAGSGIGRLLAQKFVKAGCVVIGWDLNKDGLEETQRLVDEDEKYAGRFKHRVVNVSSFDEVSRAANETQAQYTVDILINNAGIVSGNNYISDLTEKDVRRTFDVNVLAHFWTVKHFLPTMLKRDSGHIVSIASVAGQHGGPRSSDYCASKFAAYGLDNALRMELYEAGKLGIMTTVVCPYLIKTGMFHGTGPNKIPWIVPDLEPEYAAERIFDGVLRNERYIAIPRTLTIFTLVEKLVPIQAWFRATEICGLDKLLQNFVGRK